MGFVLGKLKSFLTREGFVRRVAVLVGSTALAQGIVVLASPLLTRLYSPEQFGIFAVFVSLHSLLLTVNSLRYELATPLADDEKTSASIVILVVVLVALSTVILGLVFWFLGDQISIWLNSPGLSPYLWLLLFSLFGGGIYQAFTYWAIARNRYPPIARSKIHQNLSMITAQLGLGVFSVSSGLFLGMAIGQICAVPSLIREAWRENRQAFREVRVRDLLDAARRYRRFPLFSSWSGFLNTAGLQLPAILITSIYGPQVAGWFALGQRVIGLPMALIGVSVGQVYMGRASQVARANPSQLPGLYNRAARYLFLIGLLPIGFLALIAPSLFEWVFGPEWRIAGEYVQVLSPMVLIQFVVSSISTNIFVIERQDIQSVWDTLRIVLLVAIFVVASTQKLQALDAITLYSAGMFLTYVLLFLLSQRALRQYQFEQSHG